MTIKSRSKKTVTQQNQSLSSIRRVVKSVMAANLELKTYTATVTTTASNSGSVASTSQQIIQGDGVDQREGNQITMRSIELNWIGVVNDASTVRGQFLRVILFTDRFNQGATPAVTDLLLTATVNSPLSIAAQQNNRFIVHHDFLLPLSINGPSSGKTHYKSNMTRKITYNGTTSLAAANGANSIWVLNICDVGTSTPSFSYTMKMRFFDN